MRRLTAASCLMMAAVLMMTLSAGRASASIVFTLDNVLFSDGATATGTFTTDDALTSLLDFDITTTGALAYHYTSATASAASTSLPYILVLNTPPAFEHILQLTFDNLTPTGSLITIGDFDSFEQGPGAAPRTVTGGSVIVAAVPTVPEPSSLVLASLGALALVAGRTARRRRRA
jgi:hypothetical protein